MTSRHRLRFTLVDTTNGRIYLDETIDFDTVDPDTVAERHGQKAADLAHAGIATHMVVTDPDGDIGPALIFTEPGPTS